MPSFSIQNYGEDYVNIRVRPSSPYTAYRVYVRLASSSSAVVYDEWYSGISSTFDVYVDGLDPGTEYAVNVAYNTSPTASGSQWVYTSLQAHRRGRGRQDHPPVFAPRAD